ncbi:hypothetical protein GCM10009780_42400 [Actinomadura alba]
MQNAAGRMDGGVRQSHDDVLITDAEPPDRKDGAQGVVGWTPPRFGNVLGLIRFNGRRRRLEESHAAQNPMPSSHSIGTSEDGGQVGMRSQAAERFPGS